MTTKIPGFQYQQPETLEEVFRLVCRLQNENREFIFSGGGTDVLASLKLQLDRPQTLISLSGLQELKEVRVPAPGKIRIGALTPLASLINSSVVQKFAPVLAETAKKIASPQIRTQATIGGNILVNNRCLFYNQSEHNRRTHISCFKADGELCHVVKSAARGKMPLCRARFVSDTAPVLMLLNAELILADKNGERRVALKDFYSADGIDRNGIRHGEVLSFIEVDAPTDKKIHYEKLAMRSAPDFPSLGAAVGIEPFNNGNITEKTSFAVALTGVHTCPVQAVYQSADYRSPVDMVDEACRHATRSALTFQQDLFPRGYRKQMVEVLIRRAVKHLTGDLWI